MFEIFHIKKYVKGKKRNRRREIVGKILKLEIFFFPLGGTAVNFSRAPSSLPFHQTLLEPCVSVFTTLEKSYWDESLLHESFNSQDCMTQLAQAVPSIMSSGETNGFCGWAYRNEGTNE